MTVPDDVEARIVDKMEYVEAAVTVLSEKQFDDAAVYDYLQNELEWLVTYLREIRDFLADD